MSDAITDAWRTVGLGGLPTIERVTGTQEANKWMESTTATGEVNEMLSSGTGTGPRPGEGMESEWDYQRGQEAQAAVAEADRISKIPKPAEPKSRTKPRRRTLLSEDEGGLLSQAPTYRRSLLGY